MKHEEVHTVVMPGDGNTVHVHPKPVVLGRQRHTNPAWSFDNKKAVWNEFQRLKSLPSWASRDERLVALEAQKVLPIALRRVFPISPRNPTPTHVDFYTGTAVLESIKRWNDRKVKPKTSPLVDLLGRAPMGASELTAEMIRQVLSPMLTPLARTAGEQNALITKMAEELKEVKAELKRLRRRAVLD